MFSPNEWNNGRQLKKMSVGRKPMQLRACAKLDNKLRWDNTTPLGVPSEPEVNRMVAGSPGFAAGRKWVRG